ncbi:amino acid adenylation domain-containing protein [Nocardiopsis sp. YSL2]|uniref:non-ribosomal peptide synthetase n=1 Tax=Nocardiopsis sp. YSL2 TaxID=2939492 RepID=UPI0026F47C15|nr:amino acid adenylation domain-containing protein [Nocardiopsis sp. YSL2]
MRDIKDGYPLSAAQEGILFHSTACADHSLYVETAAFRVSGALDVGALTAAWQAATGRHTVLRTAFVHERVSPPRQTVFPEASVPVDHHDLSDLTGAAKAEEVAARTDRLSAEPFDLARPPLIRLLVLRLGPTEHLMVWAYHHLILDGRSAASLVAEVIAELGGVDVCQTPRAPEFHEHIAWLGCRNSQGDRAFWTEYLAGYHEPAVLTLAGVRPGAKPSGRFRTVRASIPAETTRRLRDVAATCSTGLLGLVEAAWAGTVSRYSGRDDVVVGTTVESRPPLPGAERMVGMFSNTVPVRARVDPGLPAKEWLSRHSEDRHHVQEHRHTPLLDIQHWAGTEHGVSLFDTVVVFEDHPDPSRARPAGTAPRISAVTHETRTNYQATLVVRDDGELLLRLVVDAGVFDEDEARRTLAHTTAVLGRLADRPDVPVRALLAVPEETRTLLLDHWNGDDVDRTPPRTLLPGLIDKALAERPDHPAVVCDTVTYTYRDLDARATALAHRIASLGAGPGDRVGVCLGRGADLVTALLAIARTGAAFVPLDPDHPADRTAYILRDAAPTLVLTDDAARLPECWNGHVLDLARQGPSTSAASDGLPGAVADSLAYVIYTSGSTGRPKGVAIGHLALANLVDSLALRHPGLGPDDRFLALTTLTFDTSLAELLVPLAVGATVHVGGGSLALSGRAVDAYTAKNAITVLQATPSRYRALLDSGWRGVGRPRLYSCGEAFPADLVEPLAKRGESVWNMYGPTETTVYSSFERIHAGTTRISVGRPISNTFLRVLDSRGDLVPLGCVGELCIGGDGVADGYWNRPELTAGRFVPDPYAGPHGRMFRTGDHARTLLDGRLEVLGRIDRQLKLHGYRIEPGEIEQVLLETPDVAAAAVDVREGRLLAWTVLDGRSGQATPDELRQRLRHRLPSYMVPETVVVLKELPLTPAGKTDLLALDVPPGRPVSEASAPESAGELEEVVARLFREALAVPHVGLDDDFYALGGDSLLAMRLAVMLQAELDLDFDVERIFDHATVREVASGLAAPTTNSE